MDRDDFTRGVEAEAYLTATLATPGDPAKMVKTLKF